jgi:two-component system NtrC family sensor kinase
LGERFDPASLLGALMSSSLSGVSLRQKVIIGVAVVYLFMVATIGGSYYLTRSLDQKISYLEDITKLEESVLEIRRFEKNFFLYGDKESLTTATYHLQRAAALLEKNSQKVEALSSPEQTATFKKSLEEYERLLGKCAASLTEGQSPDASGGRPECGGEIRKIGTSMAQFAEGVAKRKRDSIKGTVSATVELPLIGLVVVGLGLVAIGSFLFTKVTLSLRLLEKGTANIAQGRFEPIGALPAERDIRNILTAFNSMADRLRDREEQLVQSKKLASLGTMLAGVAHEINNPLSNISSACEILLEELDGADKEFQQKLLKKMLEQVERARTLVLNLLEFSRTKELRLESVNLKEVLQRTLGLLEGEKPAAVSVRLDVEDTLQIDADRQRIEQAFTNLICNAFQAIDGEGEVSIRAVATTDGLVKIRIRDTGRGIPEEDLPRIFDPFFTTKDVGKGTGLGLFITHDIILRHKGTIRVESSPGRGTVFAIKLPAAEPSQ